MIQRRYLTVALGMFLCGSIGILSAAPTKEEEEVAKYAKVLKTSSKSKERVEALKELGRLGQIQVTLTKGVQPDIIKALDDKDPLVRGEAAHTIGKVDPANKKEIVGKLTKMLKEEKDERAKQGIALGLSAMGPDSKEALPALREAMQKADKKGAQVYKTVIANIAGTKKKN